MLSKSTPYKNYEGKLKPLSNAVTEKARFEYQVQLIMENICKYSLHRSNLIDLPCINWFLYDE